MNVRVPGRFQHVGSFIFDVAHNAEGAAVLAQTLASVAPPRPIVAVLSVLRDKDWRRMMQTLEPVVDRFVLTVAPTAPSSRAWDLDEVEQFAREEGIVADTELDFVSAVVRTGVRGVS